ncbi:hypothetical protein [Piscinibacter defluvii]|nr:hypothetical protein [Piscinibacter defluvii]
MLPFLAVVAKTWQSRRASFTRKWLSAHGFLGAAVLACNLIPIAV